MDGKLADVLYVRAGNSVSAWLGVAADLLTAASIIKQRVDAIDRQAFAVGDELPSEVLLDPIVFMLRGMAVECLFKGL